MSDAASPPTAKDLRQKAIRLLARREYSRQELACKLSPLGPTELVEIVLIELEQRGLQSDARFVESWVRSHGARFGAAKVRQTLRGKGLDGDLVDAQLALAELPDETARAREVWAKKFASAPADAREWSRQARFLQSRGFATDVIRRVLKDVGCDEDAQWPA